MCPFGASPLSSTFGPVNSYYIPRKGIVYYLESDWDCWWSSSVLLQ